MKPLQNLLSELTGAIDSPTVSLLTQVCDVKQRRLAKKPMVLTVELEGALIAYLKRRIRCIQLIRERFH